jgi:hypothetical protein
MLFLLNMSSSYPYWSIARYHDLDHQSYGDVLNYISAYEKGMRGLNYWEVKAVQRFQKTLIGERLIAVLRHRRGE